MKEQIISFDTAKMAKEKSIPRMLPGKCYHKNGDYHNNMPSEGYFDNYYSAPTQSLLQRWLREEHKIQITIAFGSFSSAGFEHYYGEVFRLQIPRSTKINWEGDKFVFSEAMPINNLTYEEALEASLQEALKLIG